MPEASPVPHVSVICAAYNYGRLLPYAVESVLAQGLGADELEMIVVDDGSTDDTSEAIRPYLDDPRVRYIRKENGGVASAVTVGLEEARGRFICFCDADDEWPASRLDAQLKVLEAQPKVGLVYSDMEVIDEQGNILRPSFMQMTGFPMLSGNVIDALTENNFVSGGSMMIRSEFKDRLIPIPQSATTCQDWWVAYRVAQVAEVRWVPGVVLRYRQHGTNNVLANTGDRTANVRATLEFRRLVLAAPEADQVGLNSLLKAASQLISTPREYRELVAVSDEQRQLSRQLEAEAFELEARRDYVAALRTLVRAVAADPTVERYDVAHHMAAGLEARERALAGEQLRHFRTIATAAELLAAPNLLAAYAQAFSEDDDATLIVSVSSDAELEALGVLADQVDLAADVFAVNTSDKELEAAGDAFYSRAEAVGALVELPRFDDASQLHAYMVSVGVRATL